MDKKRRSFLKKSAVGASAVVAASTFPSIWIKNSSLAYAAAGEIKVGVLFSLTGTTGIIEESLNKATILAIEEINDSGGINGMKITPVVEDPASDPATFAAKARKLVLNDKCVSVFGSYTSASRKAVLPVFEKRENLYFYPTLYEGRECSKNVVYTGAVPNQQQDEFVPWLVEKFGKRWYLIGSNYIYPKEENNYCKKLLEGLGCEVVAEEYVPLGHSEFASVVNKFKSLKPNVIFSTVVGDSVVALHRQYRAGGLDPESMPMASLTTSENEVAAMGGDAAAGHFTSAPYFQVWDSPENQKFVEAYRSRWGEDKVTHFVSEPSYFQVYMFKQAVEKLDPSDIAPDTIREAVKGVELVAPQGPVKIDPATLHTYLWPKIGVCKSDGQFEILQQSSEWLAPVPYKAYPNQQCTEGGFKGSLTSRTTPMEIGVDQVGTLMRFDLIFFVDRSLKMDPTAIMSQLITGLSIASILLLVALGLAIIYGATGVINLAHGEFVMLGAYSAWALQTFFKLNLFQSLIFIFLITALLGWIIERVVIRHLYARPLDTILATWGIGVIAIQAIRLSAGGELRYVEMPNQLASSVSFLGVDVSAFRIFILIFSAILFLLTWYLMFKTSFGVKLRAITQNPEVASSFGINSSRIFGLTFAYGAGLAGLAGALISPLKSVSPEMGTPYVIDAFFVVVLGGVESLMGTVFSALILGELTSFISFQSNDTIAKALVLLAIVILIRFRPQGLFSTKVRGG